MSLLIFGLSPSLDIFAVIILVAGMYSILVTEFVTPMVVCAQVNQKTVSVRLLMIAPVEYVMRFQVCVILWKPVKPRAQEAFAFRLWE